MIDYLGILIKKYGGILIAGIAGAIIRRIRESMTIIEFLKMVISRKNGNVIYQSFQKVQKSFYRIRRKN